VRDRVLASKYSFKLIFKQSSSMKFFDNTIIVVLEKVFFKLRFLKNKLFVACYYKKTGSPYPLLDFIKDD